MNKLWYSHTMEYYTVISKNACWNTQVYGWITNAGKQPDSKDLLKKNQNCRIPCMTFSREDKTTGPENRSDLWLPWAESGFAVDWPKGSIRGLWGGDREGVLSMVVVVTWFYAFVKLIGSCTKKNRFLCIKVDWKK